MPRILLIGRSGQISTYLQPKLEPLGELVVCGSDELNLAQSDSIIPVLEQARPDIIVNPAAYTAVDKAEEEPELAYAINRDAPGVLADWCAKNSTPLIHFSTDYVFDGNAKTPYVEVDTPAPSGVYGASKLAGERAIMHTDAPAIILRTAWVYSNHGKNFYKTMLALAQSRTELSVVADQIGGPSFAGCLAQGCANIIEQIIAQPDLASKCAGVYHFSCGGETSWHGFAEKIFAANNLTAITVNGIPTHEYPTPAKRPAFSVLDSDFNSQLGSKVSSSASTRRSRLFQCKSTEC